MRDPKQHDEKGRPVNEHWLGIAKQWALENGVTMDHEQAWTLRRLLFDAHAGGYRDGLRDAPRRMRHGETVRIGPGAQG